MNKIKISRKSLIAEARDYLMITIGMISYSIGWSVFLLPNEIVLGGVSGISSLIYWVTDFPVQLSYFAINAVLLLFALKIMGLKFCAKTIFAVITLTCAISVCQYFYQGRLLADQPFMATIIGSVFCGCGVGLGLSANGSTGGTDIIAAIINKYRDISLGRVILLCDLFIITSSYFVFKDFEKVLYGYVVLYIVAFCIDQVVNSMQRSVQFFIISEKYEEIGKRIGEYPRRGCTIINGQGFYSGNEVKMLFVLAKKREASAIFQLINEIDPHAFVSQSAVIGVYGEGFDRMKVGRKPHRP